MKNGREKEEEEEERRKEQSVAVESLSLHHFFLASMIPPWTREMGTH